MKLKVTTTTGALGTQADIVIFLLVRNNPEKNVATDTLQDLNVACPDFEKGRIAICIDSLYRLVD